MYQKLRSVQFGRAAFGAVLLAGVSMAAPAEAAVIFEQTPSLNGSGLTSDTQVQAAFDDFILPGAATITDVRWYGGVTTVPGVYEPLSGPISFTIGFYETDGGSGFLPGNLISEQVVSAANNTTAVPFVAEFVASLPIAVDLPAADRLWISIVGHDLRGGFGFAIPFSWGGATAGGPGSFGFAASLPNGGSFSLQGINLAFALESNPVPEPAALGLLGLGLAAAWRMRRRAA